MNRSVKNILTLWSTLFLGLLFGLGSISFAQDAKKSACEKSPTVNYQTSSDKLVSLCPYGNYIIRGLPGTSGTLKFYLSADKDTTLTFFGYDTKHHSIHFSNVKNCSKTTSTVLYCTAPTQPENHADRLIEFDYTIKNPGTTSYLVISNPGHGDQVTGVSITRSN